MQNITLCACGCGEPTQPAKCTSKRFGLVKGKPTRFILGHSGRKGTPEQRFSAFVQRTPDCHLWTGARQSSNGYGRFGVSRGRIVFAHRFAYEMRHGKIPDGLHILHSCDNTGCVNPDHLRAGTRIENMRDMRERGRAAWGNYQSAKTHCPKGHQYTESNTYIARGKRHCRQCKRISDKNRRSIRARMG